MRKGEKEDVRRRETYDVSIKMKIEMRETKIRKNTKEIKLRDKRRED